MSASVGRGVRGWATRSQTRSWLRGTQLTSGELEDRLLAAVLLADLDCSGCLRLVQLPTALCRVCRVSTDLACRNAVGDPASKGCVLVTQYQNNEVWGGMHAEDVAKAWGFGRMVLLQRIPVGSTHVSEWSCGVPFPGPSCS